VGADETAKIGAARIDAPRQSGARWLAVVAVGAALGGIAYWLATR
jgi:hypothetical protein